MSPSDVSVVVVNWNGRRFLDACLGSIPAGVEVVLVDNGSSDGSAASVRERFPAVRVVENGRNLGFSAANNIGAELAQALLDVSARPRRIEARPVRAGESPSLADLVGTMRRVRAGLNPALDIEGVLLTMNDERSGPQRLQPTLKDRLMRNGIPRASAALGLAVPLALALSADYHCVRGI